jgi:hypothetical protein
MIEGETRGRSQSLGLLADGGDALAQFNYGVMLANAKIF